MKTTVRKSLSMIMAVLLLSAFGGFALGASAEGEYTSGYYTYRVSDNEAIITYCDNSISGDVITPTTLGGYPVTAISASFNNCPYITSVIVSEGVTSIDYESFRNCTSLKSVHIPSTASVGTSFGGCTALETITVDENNSKYFADEYGALYTKNNGEIWLLRFPANNKATEYAVQAGTIAIANNGVFRENKNLKTITVPDSVTYIGSYAFEEAESLETVKLGNGIATIFNNTFENCKKLKSINIPDGVSEIFEYAFAGCESLEEITVPDNIYYIGQCAFYNCISLEKISLPNNAISIRINAFSNTAYYNNPENWTDGLLYIGNHFIKGAESIEECQLKDGTVSTAEGALYNCGTLDINKVSFPDSITFIGNTFHRPGDDWELWDNDCFYIDNHLITVSESVSGELKIKEGTKTIADYAFEDCTKLTSVTMPDSVTTVGVMAFSDCTSLSKVKTSNNLQHIGPWAFLFCESLNGINIPGTIRYIGAECFDSVGGPFDLTFEEAKGQHISLGYNSVGYSGVGSLILPSGITHLASGTLSFNPVVEYIHIPDTVVSISDQYLGSYKGKYICTDSDNEYLRAYAEKTGLGYKVCNGHDDVQPSDPTQPEDPVNPDNPTDDWEDSTPVINLPSRTTVNFGETLVLTLGKIEIPEGYAIAWFVEGAGVSTTVSEDGLECRVTSIANGNATIYAKLVDAEENPVTNADGEEIFDEITLVSKAGFWQKFISFFKNLFGINRVIY